MTTSFHLAQANIAHMLAPLDDPLMAGFVDRLDKLNALADSSRGFVWRLQTEDGDATAIRAFDDDRILFNLSVWESIDALTAYVYQSAHTEALRKRAKWFQRPQKPSLVLWWIAAGQLPTIDDAISRFESLWTLGPGPEAFTFSRRFPASDQNGEHP